MEIINTFAGVGVAGMSRTLYVADAAPVVAAPPAFWAHAKGAPAAITPQPKRRNATATRASVDRGTI